MNRLEPSSTSVMMTSGHFSLHSSGPYFPALNPRHSAQSRYCVHLLGQLCDKTILQDYKCHKFKLTISTKIFFYAPKGFSSLTKLFVYGTLHNKMKFKNCLDSRSKFH